MASHKDSQNKNSDKSLALLWTATGLLVLGLMFAWALAPDMIWLTAVLAVALVAVLGALIQRNRSALRSRSAAFGLNSAVTALLVIAILGVLNFMVSRYPQKLDLTKNKVHTLSDQTTKLIKGLSQPVKAVVYGKIAQREQFRPMLDNYKSMNPKFEVEYVDPDKEPARAKQAGIKKYGTLVLSQGTREQKVEDLNEEKITNAMIKLLKEKNQTLCAITGHGEKSFSSVEAEGYDSMKKALANQSYDVKDVNLMQETKVPATCDAIALLGPTKAFFPPEVSALSDYLHNGGKAIIAVDLNFGGATGGSSAEYSPELLTLLEKWFVQAPPALIVDPLSRMLGVDASVPILASYSKDHPITKDFQTNCYFPFARPLEIAKDAPAGLNVQWIGQTTPKSWGETSFSEFKTGQVKFDAGKDKNGPINVAIAVSGKNKDSKGTANTRIVVFGTSQFATNNYSRFGGNSDFFLNSVSWVLEDESLISIRAKEEGPGKVELSQKAGTVVFLLTVIVIPLLVAVGGIVIWALRRRL